MASKRLKKKKQKALLQKQVKAQAKLLNLSEKEVKRSSFNTLQTLTQKAEKVQTETRRKKRADSRKQTRIKKQKYLESLGIDVWKLRVKDIDKVKIKDIESRKVNSKNYPHLFKETFDFNKEYSLHGEKMFFAFRDFAGETSLETILSQYENLSDTVLLERLKQIVKQKPTYRRGNRKQGIAPRGSSGSAGDYRFMCADSKTVSMFNLGTYSKNKKKTKRKTHGGSQKGFQILQNENGKNSFDTVTPHSMLVIMNAFIHNITEDDRVTFYKNVYTAIRKHMPDFAEILPKP